MTGPLRGWHPPQLITKASLISSVSYLLAVFHHPAHRYSTILPFKGANSAFFFLCIIVLIVGCALAACRILVP